MQKARRRIPKKEEFMFPVDTWSKERVYDVMIELLYSFNYMWFLMEDWVKKNCPEEEALEGMLALTDEFGAYEAKRLAKTVEEGPEGIDRLIRFLEHSHWYAFENIEVTKLSDTTARMTTTECSSQRAAKKWGMEYYDCGSSALRLRSSFFRWVDPRARITPEFTPPEEKPEEFPSDTSCSWIISIE